MRRLLFWCLGVAVFLCALFGALFLGMPDLEFELDGVQTNETPSVSE